MLFYCLFSGTYFMAMITISCLSIGVTVTVLSIFHTSKGRPVPNKLKAFARNYLSCFLPSPMLTVPRAATEYDTIQTEHIDAVQMETICEYETAPSTSNDVFVEGEGAMQQEMIQIMDRRNSDVRFESSREKILKDWTEMALIFDKCFGYLLLIATCIVLAYVMVEFIILHNSLKEESAHDEHE